MNAVKFDDVDNLKIAIDKIKAQSSDILAKLSDPNSDKEEYDEEWYNKEFEEIRECIEVSTVNGMNICRMGGIRALMILMVAHSSDEIRKQACSIWNQVV